jgi:hypothetical protein
MTTWLLDGSGSVPEVELELLDGQVGELDPICKTKKSPVRTPFLSPL